MLSGLQPMAPDSPRSSDASPASKTQKTAELAQSQSPTPNPSEGKEEWAPRPPNAWILYRSDKSQELKRLASPRQGEKAPISSRQRQAEMSREISVLWKNEPQSVKDRYARKAEEERALHRQRYPNYKYRPKRRVSQNSRSMYALRRRGAPGPLSLPPRTESKPPVHVHYDLGAGSSPAPPPPHSAPATKLQFTSRRESAPTLYFPSILSATAPAFTTASSPSVPGQQQVPMIRLRRSTSLAPSAKFSTSLHPPTRRFASASAASSFDSTKATTHSLSPPASFHSPSHNRGHATFPDSLSSPFPFHSPRFPIIGLSNRIASTNAGAMGFNPVTPAGLDLETNKSSSTPSDSALLFQPTAGLPHPASGGSSDSPYDLDTDPSYRVPMGTNFGPLPDYVHTPAKSPANTFSMDTSTSAEGAFSSPFSMSHSTSAPDLVVLEKNGVEDLVSRSISPPIGNLAFQSPFTTSLSPESWTSGPLDQTSPNHGQGHGYGRGDHSHLYGRPSQSQAQPHFHPAPLLSSCTALMGLVTYATDYAHSDAMDRPPLSTHMPVTPSSAGF